MMRELKESVWAALKPARIFKGLLGYFSLHQEATVSDNLKDFVTDADHFILHEQPLRGMLIIRILVLVVVLFFVWAALTNVNELVKGDAKVVPSSHLQVLQSMDGGLIQEIMVQEGQAVKSGQPLLQIDNTRFMSSVRENQVQDDALAARAERLNAFIENRSFKIPQEATKETKDVYLQEQRYFENARYELQNQISIAKQQLSQRQQELTEVQAKRDQAKQMLDSAAHELKITKPLLSSGAVSEVDLLRLERDVSRFTGELAQANAQIQKIQASISEANRKVDQVE